MKAEALRIEVLAKQISEEARSRTRGLKESDRIQYEDGFYLGVSTGNHIKERNGHGVLVLNDNRRMEGIWH
jgi:hypothetical protein